MKKSTLLPLMVSDFLFACSSMGMAPLLSRLVMDRIEGPSANALIAQILLAFTLGRLAGYIFVGKIGGQPKVFMGIASLVSALGVLLYFTNSPNLWMVGQVVQGLSHAFYSVNVAVLTAKVIPEGKQLRGFALVGMADFLGFSTGPVISGILLKYGSFSIAIAAFILLLVFAFIASFFCPSPPDSPEPEADSGELKSKAPLPVIFREFWPLYFCLLISLLFHLFYSRYFPVLFHMDFLPIESVFFGGYVLGGIGLRLGMISFLEKRPGRPVLAISLGFMALTALLASLFTEAGALLTPLVLVTGGFYGMGFEMLYIFALAWVAEQTREKIRSKVFAFIFSSFDCGYLLAGFSFGPLTLWLTPMGLLRWMLILLPIYLLIPIFLKSSSLRK